MKKIKTKLIGLLIVMLLVALILPAKIYAAENETIDIQIVKTKDEKYVIYLKGVTGNFQYSLETEGNITDEIQLTMVNSTLDEAEEPNNVAVVTPEKVSTSKYIYIKVDGAIKVASLDFTEAFDVKDMEEVETSTKRIETKVITEKAPEQEIDGVKINSTVGGIEITENSSAEYSFFMKKATEEKYSTLMELAEKINEEYDGMDMYSKIETAKQFSKLYNELKNAETYQNVENMKVMQPSDAKNGEQYIIFLKKTEEGKEIIDVKLMTSYRVDEEEKIPAKTETVTVKETTKLPITGDSLILFAILGAIILIAIVVFIRMKKLAGKENK